MFTELYLVNGNESKPFTTKYFFLVLSHITTKSFTNFGDTQLTIFTLAKTLNDNNSLVLFSQHFEYVSFDIFVKLKIVNYTA